MLHVVLGIITATKTLPARCYLCQCSALLVAHHALPITRCPSFQVDDVFHDHCVPGFDPTYRRMRDCYSDEHYIPTLLAASGLEGETGVSG